MTTFCCFPLVEVERLKLVYHMEVRLWISSWTLTWKLPLGVLERSRVFPLHVPLNILLFIWWIFAHQVLLFYPKVSSPPNNMWRERLSFAYHHALIWFNIGKHSCYNTSYYLWKLMSQSMIYELQAHLCTYLKNQSQPSKLFIRLGEWVCFVPWGHYEYNLVSEVFLISGSIL